MKSLLLTYALSCLLFLSNFTKTVYGSSRLNATSWSTTSSQSRLSASSTAAPTSSFSSQSISQVISSSAPPTSSGTSTVSSSPPSSSSAPIDDPELELMYERRLSSIVGAVSGSGDIPQWLSTQNAEGNWDAVDYSTGCAARRANWPAQQHWQRLVVLAAAWHGGLPGANQYVKDPNVATVISKGMTWWFDRDFTNIACLDSGNTTACPCSAADTTLWNTNWFSNLILIPDLVAQTCLLFKDLLTDTQNSKCLEMTSRSYASFDRNVNGLGFLTGANALDVAQIGIDLSFLTSNTSLTTDAYRRVHNEMTIQNTEKADGIRPDGSFGQHAGILYNGNYGKDYANDILDLEVEAGGTKYSAAESSRQAFERLFEGNKWMIYRNINTGTLHWDFSVLGRFISFPVIDNQATGSIKTNLTSVRVLGEQWSSQILQGYAASLSTETASANAGNLLGNKMFYTNDYLVHRSSNYVSTLKMYSSRTQNTECVNSQNPFGFHLSDGTLYTYLHGDEYEDIAAVMDWNRIPGVTLDDATPLTCGGTQVTGVEGFVGGVSNGKVGVAAMRYTNPTTKSLKWQKAWFFLENDIQHVMVSNISSSSGRPVLSILDQRRRRGPIYIDGAEQIERPSFSNSGGTTLWHGGVGYALDFGNNATLTVQTGQKSGNWSSIGTSTQPSTTVDLFTAWITHGSVARSIAYTAFPGTDHSGFLKKQRSATFLKTIQNDGNISALFNRGTLMVVFWNSSGATCRVPIGIGAAAVTISSSGNIAMIFKVESGEVTVSDPSQKLLSVSVTFGFELWKPKNWSKQGGKTITFSLPTGGQAGDSVKQNLYH